MPSAQNKPYAKAVYFGVAHSRGVVWVAQSCPTLCNPMDYNPPVSSMGPAAAAAKLLQSCPTLCDPIDGSPPGSRIPRILQARTLEWVAISFSIVWKWKVKVKSLSRVWLLATPWATAYQAPPSMGFSRQEYWSGVPLPSPLWALRYYKYFKSIVTPIIWSGFSKKAVPQYV